MGIDESRHADQAAAVDHLRTGHVGVRADRDDGAIADADVAAREIAERLVHGQHVGATDRDVAAAGQRLGAAGLGRERRRQATDRAQRGGALENGAAGQTMDRHQACPLENTYISISMAGRDASPYPRPMNERMWLGRIVAS